MSGWKKEVATGVYLSVDTDDMSGNARVSAMVNGLPDRVVIQFPAVELVRFVADWVRTQRFRKAEADVDAMSVTELLGLGERCKNINDKVTK